MKASPISGERGEGQDRLHTSVRRAERAANSAQGGVFDCIRVKCKKKCRNSLMLAAGDEKAPSTN